MTAFIRALILLRSVLEVSGAIAFLVLGESYFKGHPTVAAFLGASAALWMWSGTTLRIKP